MRKTLKKMRGKADEDEPKRPFEFATIEPDRLRDHILAALSKLPQEERGLMRDRFLAGLKLAGVNFGSCLLLLGISVNGPDELMPSDIAKLLRYVRLNQPEALKTIATPLAELLGLNRETEKLTSPSRRAA